MNMNEPVQDTTTPTPIPQIQAPTSGITGQQIGKIIQLIRNSSNPQKQALMDLVTLCSFFAQCGNLEMISSGSTHTLKWFDRWISNLFVADGKYIPGLAAECELRVQMMEQILAESAIEAAARTKFQQQSQEAMSQSLAEFREANNLPPM